MEGAASSLGAALTIPDRILHSICLKVSNAFESQSNFNALEQEMKILIDRRNEIKEQLETADKEGKLPTRQVKKWRTEVKRIEKKLNSMQANRRTMELQIGPTTQPNIASNAQLLPGSANPLLLIAPGPMKFTDEELVKATNGFSTANFLGRGGFGDVHKGVLPSGKQVAVKQLKAGSMQGEREFQAEVEIISCVHHRHLVSLVGYCISGTQMMLVYEYVPNNTLKFHLHGKERPTMSWETRMKIALGSAKGLAYLHDDCEPNIIHRDIKADNILLDNNFVPKVADFGLAKFFPDDVTHVSTQVKGTFGYLDPEYALNEKLTDKSDVYSFGVVLLELIAGRRPIYETQSSEKENLVLWARPLLKQALEGGNFDTLVDPRLQGYNSSEMARMVACADSCLRQSGVLRPRMSQIFQALEGNIPLDNLNKGIKPGDSTLYNQDESSDYETGHSTWSDGGDEF